MATCTLKLVQITDASSRAARESYCGEVLPNLLLNRCSDGCIGGDWNNIIDKKDATKNPASKLSPNLLRLSKTFDWRDSHRDIFPHAEHFSHYYDQGATRIDRQYCWGNLSTSKSVYIPVAFSDHFGLLK